MAPLATLVLDLDGTIVDSLADLTAALNRLMAARGLAGFPALAVAAMVGDGTTKLVERAFAARSKEARKGDIGAFVADYTAHEGGECELDVLIADAAYWDRRSMAT